MAIILKYLFRIHVPDWLTLYRELIAIKPGFHEIWLDTVHDWDHIEGLKNNFRNDLRSTILKEIHGLIEPVQFSSRLEMIRHIRREISPYHYIAYAPCSYLEGSMSYRKSADISYYEALRNREKINLKDYFVIFDYFGKPIKEKDLEFLKCFQYHNCIDLQTIL